MLVVGLDPDISKFPGSLLPARPEGEQVQEAIIRFNRMVIDNIAGYAVAVKPQLAFYEVFGSRGIKALEDTVSYARDSGLLVIADAKRNDVGFVSEAYAEAFLGKGPLSADAVTVNPFLGSDGMVPFIEKAAEESRGVFFLVKTSNPSSGEIQDLATDSGRPVYERVAGLINKNLSAYEPGSEGYYFAGAVVGATYPREARLLREMLPQCILLVPGFGAQNADASRLSVYFDREGSGAVVNSSRNIIYSYLSGDRDKEKADEEEASRCIERAAEEARNRLNAIRFG